MNLSFMSTYPPVTSFQDVSLPDFTIFVGRNGSGKTKLLKSIQNGACRIDELAVDQIQYFSPFEFKLSAQTGLPETQVKQRLRQVWALFVGQSGSPKRNYSQTALGIFNQHIQRLDYDNFDRTAKSNLLLGHSENDPDSEKTRVIRKSYRADIDREVLAILSKVTDGKALCRALRQVNKHVNEVSETDVEKHFSPDLQQHNILGSSLGTVFSRYCVRQYKWARDETEVFKSKRGLDALLADYEAAHPKPWDRVNELFTSMNEYSDVKTVFNFQVTDPGAETVNYKNVDSFVFSAEIRDTNSGNEYGFDALSSGEMVLATLALSLFESEESGWQPKALLLDEIDASLHPSMTKALIETVQKSFVDQGIKVILATHSPSTVAVADPAQLREINVRNEAVVSEISQSAAIEGLSDGIATLHGASLIYESMSHPINVLSEGKNTIHIRRFLELQGISEVGIAEGLENVSSCTQLKTFADFMKIFPPKGHVVVVFDPDANSSFQKTTETDKVKKYIFQRHLKAHEKCGGGIEAVYPASTLEPFLAKTRIEITDGGHKEEIEKASLTNDGKRRFEAHLSSNGTIDDFLAYSGLLELLEDLKLEISKSEKVNSAAT